MLCVLIIFEEDAGNNFLLLADTSDMEQVCCILHFEVSEFERADGKSLATAAT